MKMIEDKLEALDNYFASKKENEKWLIIFGIVLIIAYLAFMYLLPYTKELYETSERTKQSIEKKINDNQIYLESISQNGDRNYLINKYEQQILEKKNGIQTLNQKIVFIDKNLGKLSEMLFDKKSWSTFLNSITDRAEAEKVKIDTITNEYVDSNGSFGHVLEISIGCKGKYKNIIKFINELEQNQLVTDIYNTSFGVDKNTSKIKANIDISVWGINN